MVFRVAKFLLIFAAPLVAAAQGPVQSLDQIIAALKAAQQPLAKAGGNPDKAGGKSNKVQPPPRLTVPLENLQRTPIDPKRRDEVSKLLDPLLTSSDISLRNKSLILIENWGTELNVPSLVSLLTLSIFGNKLLAIRT